MIRNIRCSNDFEVQIGGYTFTDANGKNIEDDAILLIAAQYHEINVKIFVDPSSPIGQVMTLSYVGSFFDDRHRKFIAQSTWETKTAHYRNGLVRVRPLGV